MEAALGGNDALASIMFHDLCDRIEKVTAKKKMETKPIAQYIEHLETLLGDKAKLDKMDDGEIMDTVKQARERIAKWKESLKDVIGVPPGIMDQMYTGWFAAQQLEDVVTIRHGGKAKMVRLGPDGEEVPLT